MAYRPPIPPKKLDSPYPTRYSSPCIVGMEPNFDSTLHGSGVPQAGARLRRGGMFFGSCATALLFCFTLSFQARAIILNFANLADTEIDFSGGSFSFTTNANGYQFDITSVSGGVGDSVGLDGYIAPGGPFTIGTITTNGAEQTAPVTGTGTLNITDQSLTNLTGSVQWVNITTFGVGGILDLMGIINLTNIMYSGTNSDLSALAAAGQAADVVTFQFVPAESLAQLVTMGGETSYSGSIEATSPVPEPATLTLAGMGFVGLLALGRRRKN